MEGEAWVTVFWGNGMLDAQLVKGKLESEGVPVLLKYEAVGHIYGLTQGGLGRVEVRVPQEYEEEALELLAEEPGPADDQELADEDDEAEEGEGVG
jgi:hypothetical protein